MVVYSHSLSNSAVTHGWVQLSSPAQSAEYKCHVMKVPKINLRLALHNIIAFSLTKIYGRRWTTATSTPPPPLPIYRCRVEEGCSPGCYLAPTHEMCMWPNLHTYHHHKLHCVVSPYEVLSPVGRERQQGSFQGKGSSLR